MDLLVNGDIVADTSEFTLEPNALGIIGSGEKGVERCTALRVSVVVVVLRGLARAKWGYFK